MTRLLISFVGFLMMGFVAVDVFGYEPVYSDQAYQVSGKLASAYQPSNVCPPGYESFGSAEGYYAERGGFSPYGGGVSVPAMRGGRGDLGNRTYPGGIAPYRRYGRVFGFTRRDRGDVNPYAGMNPEEGNPYAGYTITRGPRDFLMKNPPNIGP